MMHPCVSNPEKNFNASILKFSWPIYDYFSIFSWERLVAKICLLSFRATVL